MDEPTDVLAPEEKRDRWRAAWKEAHALACAGRATEALPIYVRALNAAKEAGHTSDVANLLHDAGNAATDAGQFEYAKSLYTISLIWAEKAELPPIEKLGTRIELTRVHLAQGRPAPALVSSDVNALVHEARSLWHIESQSTESTEASRQTAKRILLAALDVRRQFAHFQHPFSANQDYLDEMEALVEKDTEEHAFIRLAQIMTQIEPASSTKNSIRIFVDSIVRSELLEITMECLEDFQRLGSHVGQARALHTVAQIEMKLHSDLSAIDYAIRGLECLPHIVHPVDCEIIHDDVAMIWQRVDRIDKAAQHWLAALVIRLASGIPLKRSLIALSQHRQSNSQRARGAFKPGSVIQLIENAHFLPLREWLPTMNVSIDIIQERVDRILGSNNDDPDPVPPRRPPDSGAPPAAAAVLAEFLPSKREKQTG